MCETKGYPKQNIVALMASDFERRNHPKKKAMVKRISQAFGSKDANKKKK